MKKEKVLAGLDGELYGASHEYAECEAKRVKQKIGYMSAQIQTFTSVDVI